MQSRLQEQADAVGFGWDELLDRLDQSVPGFIELLRKED
jgi:hypothetical protein